MIESPFSLPPPSCLSSPLMTMHMWVRGKKRRRAAVEETQELYQMNQQRRGGGEPAYGSVHRRLDHPRGGGGYGGPLKHSLFGNQVFNVSGSRDHHRGSHLLYGRNDSNYNTFGEIFSQVQSSEIIRKVHCLMIFLRKNCSHFILSCSCRGGIIWHRAAIRYNFPKSLRNSKPPIYPLTWME